MWKIKIKKVIKSYQKLTVKSIRILELNIKFRNAYSKFKKRLLRLKW